MEKLLMCRGIACRILLLLAFLLVHGLGDLYQAERLIVNNGCSEGTIWIAAAGLSPSVVEIAPGATYKYMIPDDLASTRFWPKMFCNDQGQDCKLGESGGSGQVCGQFGCAPPVDSKFEATWGNQQGKVDWWDTSQVDGYTLPYTLQLSEHCKKSGASAPDIDCSGLTLSSCPVDENLGSAGSQVDLRLKYPGSDDVVGCYSPCAKLTSRQWSNPYGQHSPRDDAAKDFCCPTPPVSPKECRDGPAGTMDYTKVIHSKCAHVYAYAYDDGEGLFTCPAQTIYNWTILCPSGGAAPSPDPPSPSPTPPSPLTTPSASVGLWVPGQGSCCYGVWTDEWAEKQNSIPAQLEAELARTSPALLEYIQSRQCPYGKALYGQVTWHRPPSHLADVVAGLDFMSIVAVGYSYAPAVVAARVILAFLSMFLWKCPQRLRVSYRARQERREALLTGQDPQEPIAVCNTRHLWVLVWLFVHLVIMKFIISPIVHKPRPGNLLQVRNNEGKFTGSCVNYCGFPCFESAMATGWYMLLFLDMVFRVTPMKVDRRSLGRELWTVLKALDIKPWPAKELHRISHSQFMCYMIFWFILMIPVPCARVVLYDSSLEQSMMGSAIGMLTAVLWWRVVRFFQFRYRGTKSFCWGLIENDYKLPDLDRRLATHRLDELKSQIRGDMMGTSWIAEQQSKENNHQLVEIQNRRGHMHARFIQDGTDGEELTALRVDLQWHEKPTLSMVRRKADGEEWTLPPKRRDPNRIEWIDKSENVMETWIRMKAWSEPVDYNRSYEDTIQTYLGQPVCPEDRVLTNQDQDITFRELNEKPWDAKKAAFPIQVQLWSPPLPCEGFRQASINYLCRDPDPEDVVMLGHGQLTTYGELSERYMERNVFPVRVRRLTQPVHQYSGYHEVIKGLLRRDPRLQDKLLTQDGNIITFGELTGLSEEEQETKFPIKVQAWSRLVEYGSGRGYNQDIARHLGREPHPEDMVMTRSGQEITYRSLTALADNELQAHFPIQVQALSEAI
eukprot:TRINITY_DN27024_c0_g1_i1.p1 TRINITY_DN27024_c0_g1~~TRINITY_DN27024_c0_g1_i1.p1  ORF type:complete len:1010 (-),score=112.64 TRINITY_DN27024_c0_g1_i1:110-3139(-)